MTRRNAVVCLWSVAGILASGLVSGCGSGLQFGPNFQPLPLPPPAAYISLVNASSDAGTVQVSAEGRSVGTVEPGAAKTLAVTHFGGKKSDKATLQVTRSGNGQTLLNRPDAITPYNSYTLVVCGKAGAESVVDMQLQQATSGTHHPQYICLFNALPSGQKVDLYLTTNNSEKSLHELSPVPVEYQQSVAPEALPVDQGFSPSTYPKDTRLRLRITRAGTHEVILNQTDLNTYDDYVLTELPGSGVRLIKLEDR